VPEWRPWRAAELLSPRHPGFSAHVGEPICPCQKLRLVAGDLRRRGQRCLCPDCQPGDPAFHRLDPPSGRDEALGTLENRERYGGGTIAVSPDGRTILYPKAVREGSDLLLIENFR
jgi:hypothetical protein